MQNIFFVIFIFFVISAVKEFQQNDICEECTNPPLRYSVRQSVCSILRGILEFQSQARFATSLLYLLPSLQGLKLRNNPKELQKRQTVLDFSKQKAYEFEILDTSCCGLLHRIYLFIMMDEMNSQQLGVFHSVCLSLQANLHFKVLKTRKEFCMDGFDSKDILCSTSKKVNIKSFNFKNILSAKNSFTFKKMLFNMYMILSLIFCLLITNCNGYNWSIALIC